MLVSLSVLVSLLVLVSANPLVNSVSYVLREDRSPANRRPRALLTVIRIGQCHSRHQTQPWLCSMPSKDVSTYLARKNWFFLCADLGKEIPIELRGNPLSNPIFGLKFPFMLAGNPIESQRCSMQSRTAQTRPP